MRILVIDYMKILVSNHIDVTELEHSFIQMVKGVKIPKAFW